MLEIDFALIVSRDSMARNSTSTSVEGRSKVLCDVGSSLFSGGGDMGIVDSFKQVGTDEFHSKKDGFGENERLTWLCVPLCVLLSLCPFSLKGGRHATGPHSRTGRAGLGRKCSETFAAEQ